MMLFKRFLSDLVALLFPNLCCGCSTSLYHGEEQLCTKCIYYLPYTDHHLHTENAAARQLWGRLPCHAVMSLLYFKKGARTQNIIHNLKYRGRKDLGIKLGNMIAQKLLLSTAYDGIDLIVPVPLHRRREHQRGYNQSLCIAQGISSVLKVPVNTYCLLRKRSTTTQTKKGRYNRFENMLGVFSITDPTMLKGKHILLVDDVITTGATLEACGIVLFEAKISKLSIATVAFAK
ncbi:MAG: phosphoribosyltransferase family protein [Candidatus Pedobacter colombiensis]|uniref:Phosphoribosyltransferase family protein n=1 Tax=Candidatus Pedobacter colombiensis TaxID=3121371 RepID=A0AAJ5W846_9SPHI|nr:phosphoribosyltransferase family protein [Pedobacter sp.]WEK19719.1 MAG: phosphoribosyltransferase family protein [Pedobacter sp.]